MHFQPLDNETRKSQNDPLVEGDHDSIRIMIGFRYLDDRGGGNKMLKLHYENSKHGGKGEISTLGFGWNQT